MDPKVRCSTLGTPLRELAGHDDLLSKAEVALHRVKNGRPARGQFLLGPRGVGKTALLYRIAALAGEARAYAESLFEYREVGAEEG
jgi:replication-associated recombination protein RarA